MGSNGLSEAEEGRGEGGSREVGQGVQQKKKSLEFGFQIENRT